MECGIDPVSCDYGFCFCKSQKTAKGGWKATIALDQKLLLPNTRAESNFLCFYLLWRPAFDWKQLILCSVGDAPSSPVVGSGDSFLLGVRLSPRPCPWSPCGRAWVFCRWWAWSRLPYGKRHLSWVSIRRKNEAYGWGHLSLREVDNRFFSPKTTIEPNGFHLWYNP